MQKRIIKRHFLEFRQAIKPRLKVIMEEISNYTILSLSKFSLIDQV